MEVDLRSDTVTKPTPEMLEAMQMAKVGDDVFDEDPTVKNLEAKVAAYFGKEAGLFCPSGTMTNQIAIRISTNPQDEVICDERAHLYNYEAAGLAYNSMVSVKLLNGDRGRFSAQQVLESIRPNDIHAPVTSVIALENTVNKGGGCYYSLASINAIYEVAKSNNLKLHLDGARVFNALVETGDNPTDLGDYFDTISVCLSKGLGAPIGSLLLADRVAIQKAKRVRKVMGGGMRQVGYLAAAGIYAFENHVDRLQLDHEKAKILAATLSGLPFIKSVLPADSNIVIATLEDEFTTLSLLSKLSVVGIKAVAFGPRDVRFVTHLDFTDDMLAYTIDQLKQIVIEP